MKPNIARRWFVEVDGRAQGPYEQSQVQELARLKKITPMTKLFVEGDVRWRLINEFDEFKIAPEATSPQLNREWVVLKRKTLKEAELSQNKFDQIGPFTIDEINEQLKTGDLSYNDYAWKKGFQRWAKLEALAEFNATIQPAVPKIPDVPKPIAFVTEPKLELNTSEQEELDNFTVTNTQTFELEADKSKVEAVHDAEFDKPKGGTRKAVRAVEENIIERQLAHSEMTEETDASAESAQDSDEITIKPGISFGRKVLRVALASTAAVLMTLTAYNFVKEKYSPAPTKPEAPAVATNIPARPALPPPASVEPVAPALDPAPVVESQPSLPAQQQPAQAAKPMHLPAKQYSKADYEMPKNPRLELEVIKPDSTGQIVFSTNAPVNVPIEVKISAKSGQILKYASYSQTLKIQRQGGEVPSIQLAALKLPSGTYTVQGKFADLTKQKTFFYGVKDAKFQKALEAHLKRISTEQIAEKRMVFYFLRDLESTTKNLDMQRAKAGQNQAQWSKAYISWRKDVLKSGAKSFSGLRKMNLHDIAYPDVIAKAKELSQSLLKQGEEMNSAVIQNRYLSSSGVGPILTEIRDLKKQVAVMSRY